MNEPSVPRFLIDEPYSYKVLGYMSDKAMKAGWKGDRSTINVHQAPREDLQFKRNKLGPVRVLHFTDTECNAFTLKTRAYCVVLLKDGKVIVAKHFVGLCPYCHYDDKYLAWSVSQIRFKRAKAKRPYNKRKEK